MSDPTIIIATSTIQFLGEILAVVKLNNHDSVFIEKYGIRYGETPVSWHEILAFLESHDIELKGEVNAKSHA